MRRRIALSLAALLLAAALGLLLAATRQESAALAAGAALGSGLGATMLVLGLRPAAQSAPAAPAIEEPPSDEGAGW